MKLKFGKTPMDRHSFNPAPPLLDAFSIQNGLDEILEFQSCNE